MDLGSRGARDHLSESLPGFAVTPSWGGQSCCVVGRGLKLNYIYIDIHIEVGHYESLSRRMKEQLHITHSCSLLHPTVSWLLQHERISVSHLEVWRAGWVKICWHPLARADDQCSWCSTNCQILCFSGRPEVAGLWWVSRCRDSSQIWHLNSASKRNTETPQLSQGAHS